MPAAGSRGMRLRGGVIVMAAGGVVAVTVAVVMAVSRMVVARMPVVRMSVAGMPVARVAVAGLFVARMVMTCMVMRGVLPRFLLLPVCMPMAAAAGVALRCRGGLLGFDRRKSHRSSPC
jgi:hypothetical protein